MARGIDRRSLAEDSALHLRPPSLDDRLPEIVAIAARILEHQGRTSTIRHSFLQDSHGRHDIPHRHLAAAPENRDPNLKVESIPCKGQDGLKIRHNRSCNEQSRSHLSPSSSYGIAQRPRVKRPRPIGGARRRAASCAMRTPGITANCTRIGYNSGEAACVRNGRFEEAILLYFLVARGKGRRRSGSRKRGRAEEGVSREAPSR